MKIAIFTDLYLEVAGGIPSSIRVQKEELERLGHEVTVFCPGWSCDEKDVVLVPTSKRLKINGAPMAQWPGAIERWLAKEYPDFAKQFDIAHIHYEAGASIAGVKYARKCGVPVVQTMHGREDMAIAVNVPHPFKTLVGWLLCFIHGRYLKHEVRVKTDTYLASTLARAKMWTLMVGQANAADVVVTPSKHFKKKLERYGVKRKIEVISNGVADEIVGRKWSERKLMPGERLKMIWTSRVSKEKRVVPFLVALSMVESDDWEMAIYGVGNELKKVKKMIKRYGLGDRVFLKGEVSHAELIERMQEAHLVAMASYGFDTQGLTLLEAEAMGLPVFYCDPDMKEVVPRSGAIYSSGPSSEEMAEAISIILQKPQKIEGMSRAMLERRNEVAQSRQIKKLLKVYSDALTDF